MSYRYCIINPENKLITDKILSYGYKCIYTEKSANVSEAVSSHADVLYLILNEKELKRMQESPIPKTLQQSYITSLFFC